jgi:hypothetical protein
MQKRAVVSGATVALAIVFAVLAFTAAPHVDAGAEATEHYLGSGLIRVAASGERLEFMVVNEELKTRALTLEIIDAANVVRVSKQVNLEVGKSASVWFDPPAPIHLRARAMLYQDVGDAQIQCNDFPISLQLINTASPAKTKIYVGDFTHWHKDVV